MSQFVAANVQSNVGESVCCC